MKPPQNLGDLDERASEPTGAVLESLRPIAGDVLVLGAGGKMGPHLCRMLQRGFAALNLPNRVIAVSRFSDAASRRSFESHGIETITSDLTRAEDLDSLPSCATVFFLAGIKFGTENDPGALELFNKIMPAMVAERFHDASIVALSTGCVYPYVTPESGGATEEQAPAPLGAYAESCLAREQAFTTASVKHSARTTLVRLNYSVDLRYGVLVDIARKVLAGQPVDVTTGFANVIWQGDAIAHIIQSLSHAGSPPFIINITGSQTLSIRDVASKFGAMMGKNVRFTGHESDTAWLSNASHSHQLFGAPRIHENTLIEWVADWTARGGETLDKPTHFETRDGKF